MFCHFKNIYDGFRDMQRSKVLIRQKKFFNMSIFKNLKSEVCKPFVLKRVFRTFSAFRPLFVIVRHIEFFQVNEPSKKFHGNHRERPNEEWKRLGRNKSL